MAYDPNNSGIELGSDLDMNIHGDEDHQKPQETKTSDNDENMDWETPGDIGHFSPTFENTNYHR